jgi:hypothetical protein
MVPNVPMPSPWAHPPKPEETSRYSVINPPRSRSLVILPVIRSSRASFVPWGAVPGHGARVHRAQLCPRRLWTRQYPCPGLNHAAPTTHFLGAVAERAVPSTWPHCWPWGRGQQSRRTQHLQAPSQTLAWCQIHISKC